jgi:hypothetical protein
MTNVEEKADKLKAHAQYVMTAEVLKHAVSFERTCDVSIHRLCWRKAKLNTDIGRPKLGPSFYVTIGY